jgi:hypothetical protein
MEVYLPRMMDVTAQPQPAGAPGMDAVARVMVAVSKAFAYGMIILLFIGKGIFYAVGARYMTRRKVRELFERAAARRSPVDAALAGD